MNRRDFNKLLAGAAVLAASPAIAMPDEPFVSGETASQSFTWKQNGIDIIDTQEFRVDRLCYLRNRTMSREGSNNVYEYCELIEDGDSSWEDWNKRANSAARKIGIKL